jgi:hypothetical protein
VLLVRLKNPIKVGLGMEDVPIVVNAVAMFGQKVCKVEKGNIANKGTAFSLLIVRVMGISPNVPSIAVRCGFNSTNFKKTDKR